MIRYKSGSSLLPFPSHLLQDEQVRITAEAAEESTTAQTVNLQIGFVVFCFFLLICVMLDYRIKRIWIFSQ